MTVEVVDETHVNYQRGKRLVMLSFEDGATPYWEEMCPTPKPPRWQVYSGHGVEFDSETGKAIRHDVNPKSKREGWWYVGADNPGSLRDLLEFLVPQQTAEKMLALAGVSITMGDEAEFFLQQVAAVGEVVKGLTEDES